MARITVKSRNRIDVRLNIQELNTLTIALALLDIPTMEQELKDQGLSHEKAEYDHLTMFKTLTDITGLYPQVQLQQEDDAT
ncbi:hypothetical protein [Paenibacillus agilis]|uniref:Uncharacterized protein n=1 Tax=Paenibacillus agilis TaxID=3020863 RepID=A0A559IEA4_9BACL|nr:hypothetical protein [Paenibacillus agilis]TVX85987.1 hypothetical protein FPZ44_23855 [Paenibacillus agilis]